MKTISGSLLALLLTITPALANGNDKPKPKTTGAVILGQDAFKPAPTGPPQTLQPPVTLKPLVEPEVDQITGMVSLEQLREIIARTPAPEDKRMLQRAFDKLMLLERDRRTYAHSVRLLIESCSKMIEAAQQAADSKKSAPSGK